MTAKRSSAAILIVAVFLCVFVLKSSADLRNALVWGSSTNCGDANTVTFSGGCIGTVVREKRGGLVALTTTSCEEKMDVTDLKLFPYRETIGQWVLMTPVGSPMNELNGRRPMCLPPWNNQAIGDNWTAVTGRTGSARVNCRQSQTDRGLLTCMPTSDPHSPLDTDSIAPVLDGAPVHSSDASDRRILRGIKLGDGQLASFGTNYYRMWDH